jgi:hypothetical protein
VADRETPRLARWEWHGDGPRPTRRVDLVSITGMEEAASTEQRLSRRTVVMWRRGCAGWITKPVSPADC